MKKIFISLLFLGGLFLLNPVISYGQEVISGSATIDKKVLKEQAKIEKAKESSRKTKKNLKN